MSFRIMCFAVVMGGAMVPSILHAQNANSIETRLDRMEREMQTLSRSVFKGDVPPPQLSAGGNANASQTASMELRLNQMDEQIRRMTGMIEENGYRLRQMEQKIETAAQSSTASSPSPVNQAPLSGNDVQSSSLTVDNTPYQLGTVTSNSTQAGNTPAGLYDRAFSFMQTKDYASAQATFEDFIKQYPNHSLVANAKYWLGETFYARGDYESASRAFAVAFKDFPDGQKSPDALLKLAMSLKGQNMTDEACLTLSELAKRFPNAAASVTDKAAEEKQAYGCE